MAPLTVDEVQQFAADERWQELFDRLVEHLAAYPAVLGKLPPEDIPKLVNIFLLMAGPRDDPVH